MEFLNDGFDTWRALHTLDSAITTLWRKYRVTGEYSVLEAIRIIGYCRNRVVRNF